MCPPLTSQLDMRVHALKLEFQTLNEENKDCLNIVIEIFEKIIEHVATEFRHILYLITSQERVYTRQ